MDRNTLTGLLLIGAIVIGFGILNRPSEEEIKAAQQRSDSLELVKKAENEAAAERQFEEQKTINNEAESIDVKEAENDSLRSLVNTSAYGVFAKSALGEGEIIKIENEVLSIYFNTKGGKIEKATLKNYDTYDGAPLTLIDSTSEFNLNFFTKDNKNIYTDNLVFETQESDASISGEGSKSISFKLKVNDNQYLEHIYTIKGDDYMIDFDLNLVGLNDVLDTRSGELGLNWTVHAPNQEKSLKSQRDATTLFFQYKGDEIDDITPTGDEREDYEADIKWVSLKQQFFNTTIIADDYFDKSRAYAELSTNEDEVAYVRSLKTALTIPVSGAAIESFGMSMYLGPNDYYVLSKYELGLENIINLGWGIFGWVNEFIVIPVFDYLDSFDWSYGIIILILTILLKLVLMPITYKTYLSGAKMRVLKPEINEINEKYKDDAMKKQEAMMTLYRQTGVNPLSGCIPMLIQMPILIAMFRFFPSSIQLRQESFLWADDLSSYDSIYNFPEGFEIPFYGDHVSLFTLLMALSLAFYTRMNSSMSMGAAADGPMAAQMKIMTYLMPVMMLFFFNSYSAGLSYYYFLANVISMGQTLLIRKVFINEEAIRSKIEKNKKRPAAKKKSGFQKRLEEMAKQKGYQPPKK